VPSKGALKVLPKIAVAVPPNRTLDITKCLRWEKNKQGELEVLPKGALASCKIGISSGGIKQADSRCFAREHAWCLQCNLVQSKGTLQ